MKVTSYQFAVLKLIASGRLSYKIEELDNRPLISLFKRSLIKYNGRFWRLTSEGLDILEAYSPNSLKLRKHLMPVSKSLRKYTRGEIQRAA